MMSREFLDFFMEFQFTIIIYTGISSQKVESSIATDQIIEKPLKH